MKILTADECRAIYAGYKNPMLLDGDPVLPCAGSREIFYIPKDYGMRLEAARLIADRFVVDGSLLWVYDWPLAQDEETRLMSLVRAGLGETRLLIQAPGYLFDGSDADYVDATGLILLLFLFNWEGYLTTPNQERIIQLGDEMLEIESDIPDEFLTLQESFRKFEARWKKGIRRGIKWSWRG